MLNLINLEKHHLSLLLSDFERDLLKDAKANVLSTYLLFCLFTLHKNATLNIIQRIADTEISLMWKRS